tara:strand:+ start:421 stop:609 length:189 start_codon:yes stop_codon:yes gene_type:complete
MSNYYIHKVKGGFNVRLNDKPLNSKGNPTGKPAVFKTNPDAQKFISDLSKPEEKTEVKPVNE